MLLWWFYSNIWYLSFGVLEKLFNIFEYSFFLFVCDFWFSLKYFKRVFRELVVIIVVRF